jgi:hypothetical protein
VSDIPDNTITSDIFCADLARQSSEPMAGTAPTVGSWFLLEYNGPWTAKATSDNDLPRSIQAWLTEGLALIEDSRLQFIKRSRPTHRAGISFFIALTEETAPRLYEFRLNTYDDLQTLDISAPLLGAAAYDRYLRTEPLYLVCTNGKRDRCCSRDGLALYQPLVEEVGDAAWQCTHLGGHRYAPTLVTFPDGAFYGRLRPSDLAPLVQAQTEKALYLSHLRGRCCYDDVVQAAESFLRQETGFAERNAYRLLDVLPIDETLWTVRLGVPATGETHRLTVSRKLSDSSRLVSCSPPKSKPIVQFQLVSHEIP